MKGGFEEVSLWRRRTGVGADVGAVLGKEDRSTTCSTRPTEVGVLQSVRYLKDPPPQETGHYDAGKEVWLSGESWGRSRICWGGGYPIWTGSMLLSQLPRRSHTRWERDNGWDDEATAFWYPENRSVSFSHYHNFLMQLWCMVLCNAAE